MLALGFREGEYAFVYHKGQPIGAIFVGEARGSGRFALRFSGGKDEFEVLRPSLVERRFGPHELEKLTRSFLPDLLPGPAPRPAEQVPMRCAG